MPLNFCAKESPTSAESHPPHSQETLKTQSLADGGGHQTSGRETETDRDRQRQTETDRETERQRDRGRERSGAYAAQHTQPGPPGRRWPAPADALQSRTAACLPALPLPPVRSPRPRPARRLSRRTRWPTRARCSSRRQTVQSLGTARLRGALPCACSVMTPLTDHPSARPRPTRDPVSNARSLAGCARLSRRGTAGPAMRLPSLPRPRRRCGAIHRPYDL
jgi:hypothetical protein